MRCWEPRTQLRSSIGKKKLCPDRTIYFVIILSLRSSRKKEKKVSKVSGAQSCVFVSKPRSLFLAIKHVVLINFTWKRDSVDGKKRKKIWKFESWAEEENFSVRNSDFRAVISACEASNEAKTRKKKEPRKILKNVYDYTFLKFPPRATPTRDGEKRIRTHRIDFSSRLRLREEFFTFSFFFSSLLLPPLPKTSSIERAGTRRHLEEKSEEENMKKSYFQSVLARWSNSVFKWRQQTGTKAKLDTTFFLLSSSTVVSPHENGV